MANNEKILDQNGQKIEKESERPGASRFAREQRAMPKIKDRIDETRLPTPPSDPWPSQWYPRNTSAETMQPRNFEEVEDMLAYLTDLETPPSDSQASECPSRNSTASTITVPNLCMEEAFDHLNRLYSLTEQILELRHRTTNFFKRVRNLEKLKVLRNANRALEEVFASDYDAANDFAEEDTGFADSLLDAMISNCREPAFQRRSTRTPRRPRNKFDFQKQTSRDDVSKNAPKVSKWTRVKAAFKWERAYANDAAVETPPMDTAAATTPTSPITPTTKHLGVPDLETGNSGSSSPSFYIDDVSDTGTPFGRTSTASLSNEAFCECSPKNISNHSEHSRTKEDRREQCTDRRSQSLDRNVVALDAEQVNDNGQEKEAIRVTEEKNGTVYPSNGIDEKDARLTSKRPPPPSLRITIPPLNDDIRCVPSPESNSSLSSSAHTPSGNSPLLRNIHREQSSAKHFKRQQSAIEESIASRIRGQDSKWSKVRRAFLTNSPLCIPPSPVKVVSRQMFLQNGQECSTPGSCSASAEDLEQLTALNAQTDTQRDYRVLREKLGAEFHQKLVEWERIKNLSPRPHAKDSREASSNLLNPRDHFLSEERLSFEFRKKLQDWKRVKKERRGSTSFEQQRFNRRRLTDWQLWKSPLKTECRNRGIAGQRVSCGDSAINVGRSHLSEDFLRKMDVWKRMNETANCDTELSARSKLNRLGIGSGIDESEFLTLEKALSLFNCNTIKERGESDTQQLDKFIDGNTKSYIDAGSNANYTDQVLVQTPAGSYRFEGISREFTRKLYDWEKHRGISPRSSTFRLLGPAFDPLLRESNIEIPITPITKSGSGEQVFYSDRSFRRSKSADDLTGRSSLNESFIRRSTSLQLLNHMANTLEKSSRVDSLLISSNCRRVEETTEDILMDDSEPEAMIVDIEDVIEETASPLKRMQPHQTPVYSVAASETTSIAVPLGTVTSSHEPSPVLFIEIEDTLDRKPRKPKDRDHRNCSALSQNISDVEYFAPENVLNDTRHSSSNEDVNSDCSSILDSTDENKYHAEESFHSIDRDSRKDLTKTNDVRSIEQNRKCGIAKELMEQQLAAEDSFEKKEVPSGPSNEGTIVETVTAEQRFDGSDECETVRRWNLGKHSTFATNIKESTDLSGEEKHDRECDHDRKTEQDGGSCNVRNVTEVLTRLERGNQYENVKSAEDPYYCSLIDRRPLTTYETYNTERLSGSSATSKLESTNFESSYCTSRENKGESHDLGKKSNSFQVKSNVFECGSLESYAKRLDHQRRNDRAGDTMLEESTVIRPEEHKLEKISTSKLPAKNTCNSIHNREPTAQTTSFLSVDEEILNNVIVRSIGKGCAGSAKALRQSIDSPTANDLARERDRRSSNDDNIPVNFEKPAKKQYSPTRNVFIKTKRMIFSPFRREEDYFSRRKDSNGSDSDQACSLKTKGKSRSASPKINQQDVLSRMSFSLPWPIGSFSKDQETKEPRNQTEIVYKNKRTSSLTSENNVFRKSSFQSTTVKFAEEAKRTTSGKLEDRASVAWFSGKREERKNEASPLEFDPSSSDLMHKLQILSSVVAKRDGRSTISEELSVESRSLRMRRAKQDFLSRRGGPLFHSVVEPSFDDQIPDVPRTSIIHREHVSGKRDTSDSNNAPKSAPSVRETKRKTTNTEEAGTLNEDEINASSGSDASLSDRAKSASTGMINVDPDIFNRLTESGRGCESLPRTSSKLQKPGGPLAKIVNKCKFIRLICGKEQNNLNTIARLCRQSLLIDIKNDFEKHWEADERANKATREE